MKKVLFVDRDGTIIKEPADCQVDRLDKVEFVPGSILGLVAFVKAGWRLVLVSNQDGLGTDQFPRDAFEVPQAHMLGVLRSCGVEFDEVLVCPHLPSDACLCRKPQTGLVRHWLNADFDRAQSLMVGDRVTDRSFAENLGVAPYILGQDTTWDGIVTRHLRQGRAATIERKTKETWIEAAVELDASGPLVVDTGQPFFDHLLEQIGTHAAIKLCIKTRGDWQVDDHHAIEDTALVLGQALRKALGDRRGIARYGFTLPMDEAKAACTLDLSGRPYAAFTAPFTRETVGGLATEMIPHFFRSLADGLGATIHVEVTGVNHHHLAEAAFKSFGRALRQAIARDGSSLLPSSKGAL